MKKFNGYLEKEGYTVGKTCTVHPRLPPLLVFRMPYGMDGGINKPRKDSSKKKRRPVKN